MQPYNPRQQVNGQMMCPMCAQNESHRMANQIPPRFAVRHAQGRLSKTASAEQRLAHFVASDQPRIVRIAHDSGDSSTIFHCPFCFTESTRYITESGVKTFGETVGTVQRVLTADRDERTSGRWVDAHIHEFGEQEILRVTLRRNKRTKIVEATPEHRWLVKANLKRQSEKAPKIDRRGKPRDWRPTHCARNHLLESDNVRLKRNGTRECKVCAAQAIPVGGVSRSTDRDVITRDLKAGDRLSYLRQEGVGDLFPDEEGIRHGIVFGDGSAHGNTASVSLWGHKDKDLSRFFPGRRFTAVNTADRVLGTGVPGVRVSGGLLASMKALPQSDDVTYLYGWLAGYFAVDGSVSQQGQVILTSAKLEHLEAVRDIALKLGIATYDITMKMRIGFPGREPSAIYGIEFVGSTLNEEFFLNEGHRDRFRVRDYVYERLGWTVVSVEETGRVEKVYCAVVSDTHSFALDGHIWVGNCGSGQVIARSDGGVECEFCHASFTVQVQPQFSAFPQSIGGMPIDVPGMGPDEGMAAPQDLAPGAQPAGPGGAGGPVPPGAQGGAESQPGEEGDPQEETDEDQGDDNPFSSKSKTSYLTHTGATLDRDAYMRYLALQHASNRDEVLARIKAENGKGSR